MKHKCPACLRLVGYRKNGTFARHHDSSRTMCPMTGRYAHEHREADVAEIRREMLVDNDL